MLQEKLLEQQKLLRGEVDGDDRQANPGAGAIFCLPVAGLLLAPTPPHPLLFDGSKASTTFDHVSWSLDSSAAVGEQAPLPSWWKEVADEVG